MKGRGIHVRVDPSVYQQVKDAKKAGKLLGSLGQIVERGLVSELERVAESVPDAKAD